MILFSENCSQCVRLIISLFVVILLSNICVTFFSCEQPLDRPLYDVIKQIAQSKDESQQIAVWRLLYWLQHLDQYSSRLQVILRPDIRTRVIRFWQPLNLSVKQLLPFDGA